jgi:hypothetical protein
LPSMVYIPLLGVQLLKNTLAKGQQAIGGFVTEFVNYMRCPRSREQPPVRNTVGLEASP